MNPRSTPLGVAQEDLDAVEAIVRSAGTSFYHGMRVLPPDRRHAMYAIYAFCRIVDDIADEEGILEQKRIALTAWRNNIAMIVSGLCRSAGDPGVGRRGSTVSVASMKILLP